MHHQQKHSRRYTQKVVPTTRGFSLVETLVAITILLVAIMGPMTIAARGLQSAFFAREQITAFSLAQEGVELVRAMRDQSALANAAWLSNVPPSCRNANGCGLDMRGIVINSCTTGDACRLNYDSGPLFGNRGFYTYAAGTPTPYRRRIVVDPWPGGREAEITVTVSWQSGLFSGEKQVLIQSRIFNQYDNL